MYRDRSAAIVAALDSDLPDEIKRRYANSAIPRKPPKSKPPKKNKSKNKRG